LCTAHRNQLNNHTQILLKQAFIRRTIFLEITTAGVGNSLGWRLAAAVDAAAIEKTRFLAMCHWSPIYRTNSTIK